MIYIDDMSGTEKAKYFWKGKTNNTPNAKKLKVKLEEYGHTDIHVWWEQLGPAMEMCGNSGGYMFVSNEMDIQPIGLSFDEAMDHLAKSRWYDTSDELFNGK
jgi:hypothetical protein